jgi:hypothetical protein
LCMTPEAYARRMRSGPTREDSTDGWQFICDVPIYSNLRKTHQTDPE